MLSKSCALWEGCCGFQTGSGPRKVRRERLASRSGLCRSSKANANNVTENAVELGKTGLSVSPLGIGTFSWGDSTGFWEYGKDFGEQDIRQAYQAAIDLGVTFLDSAEIYGFGQSEKFLGQFMKETGTSPVIATKYPPLPWRLSSETVPKALRASLDRLQIDKAGLYMIHWPGFFWNALFNDAYVEGLATCVEEGLTTAVGVSNFNEERMRTSHKILSNRGVPLASNQVQYSLLYRAPETNGVMETCKELGVTLVSYCPLAQGVLTGKYTPESPPTGGRKNTVSVELLRNVQPLLEAMREIGEEHGGKTLGQVAVNWTLCKGALPIVGVKTKDQVIEAHGALGWRLSEGEIQTLDDISSKCPMATGAPYENW